MPVYFLRRLTGRTRTRRANRQLGAFLAFIAGAVNAGGYLAIKQYTSHMTGIVSSIADNLVLGNAMLAFAGACALTAFMSGAATTAVMIYWNRHNDPESAQYVAADRDKLLIHGATLGMFFVGGVAGALGFKAIGFLVTIPLALLLLALAVIPVIDDIFLLPALQRIRR